MTALSPEMEKYGEDQAPVPNQWMAQILLEEFAKANGLLIGDKL